MTKFTDEGLARFSKKIRKMGVDDKLIELGLNKYQIRNML
jgi:hypothetical protein